MCRTAVELSIARTKSTRLARVAVYARAVGGCAFQEQERGQNSRAKVGYRHGNPTCTCYRRDCCPGPDPGGTHAIDLNEDDNSFCRTGLGDTISRRGGSWSWVFVNVVTRHRRQVGTEATVGGLLWRDVLQRLGVTRACEPPVPVRA